jgi:hypothetical protein
MNKRFILTEEDKNEIVSLYSQKNIVLEQAAEKQLTVMDIQNKLVKLGYGDMLGKFGADGKFGKMTYSAITQAIDFIEKRNQSQKDKESITPMATRDVKLELPTNTDVELQIPTTSPLSQLNKDIIKTPYDAEQAIKAAKLEADRIKEQGKITQEMCRTIGRAVNPINPFKKEVASQSLCDALRNCISNNMLVRDETVFTACNTFPAKQTTPVTGSTQTTNTTTA